MKLSTLPKTESHRRPQQGFTLVELLLVLVILGILAAIVLVFLLRGQRRAFRMTLISALCLIAGLAIYFVFIEPANAAMKAMKTAYGQKAVGIGCGGSIGFVGPLADLFGGAPALLLGIEDPRTNAHAPNESLHEGDWKKLMASLSQLFNELGSLPGGKVK